METIDIADAGSDNGGGDGNDGASRGSPTVHSVATQTISIPTTIQTIDNWQFSNNIFIHQSYGRALCRSGAISATTLQIVQKHRHALVAALIVFIEIDCWPSDDRGSLP